MKTLRIAMWSGPRNISTAMMRSWENRKDTQVVDEPLYGPFLHHTQKQHPMAKEIIKHQGSDEKRIIDHLIHDEIDDDKSIYYQKHMCHHILEGYDISWILNLTNIFLIRDPHFVMASYLKKHKNPTPEDLGYPQQLKLFNYIKDISGSTPIVLDSKEILKNPKEMIELLCSKLSVTLNNSMFSWSKGSRATDGIWASHWYNRVIESTGFSPYQEKTVQLSKNQKHTEEACRPYYLELSKYTLNTP